MFGVGFVHVWVQCSWSPEKGGGAPGAGVIVVGCFVWVLSTELGSSLRTVHSLNL